MSSYEYDRLMSYGQSYESRGDSYAASRCYLEAKSCYFDAAHFYDDAANVAYKENDMSDYYAAQSKSRNATGKARDMSYEYDRACREYGKTYED